MLRVGSVPYLVGRPLDTGLEYEPGIELSYAVPARLVDGLRDGSIDVALVSSIELFRRPGYGYLDGPAVCGRGYVSSVQVFLRRPIEEVRSVALDPASRTSAILSRVVWPEGATAPDFVEVADDADPRRAGTDAWLRIGDEALRELHATNARPVFNPSEAWGRITGLPFVFAPWIVREGVDLAPHVAAFARAEERGRSAIVDLARREAQANGLPEEPLVRYLTEECLYLPGEELGAALLAFRDRAAALGLADGGLEPRAISMS